MYPDLKVLPAKSAFLVSQEWGLKEYDSKQSHLDAADIRAFTETVVLE